MKHDLLTVNDLTVDETREIFRLARWLKADLNEGTHHAVLVHKSMALLFEKPSLRTRVSFDVGMQQLGGVVVYLSSEGVRLGVRESVADVARTLERMVDVIVARVFRHDSVVGLAEYSGTPVVNALSDLAHPCQALADLMTLEEHKGHLEGLKLAFIGDGNNVCNSLIWLTAKLGVDIAVASPSGYAPTEETLARRVETGTAVTLTDSPEEAVEGADAVYTDVWTSMGQEEEAARRIEAFQAFQVNAKLMTKAKPDAVFLHCLPAHRGEEVTDEVIDGPQSVAFDQAENRLHAQKGVLVFLLGDEASC